MWFNQLNRSTELFWRRFIAYIMIAFLLLIIYQVVFMARTSANRDWNHLHNVKFTLPALQRFVMRNVSDDELSQWMQFIERNERLGVPDRSFPKYFSKMAKSTKKSWPKQVVFPSSHSYVDGQLLWTSPHNEVFALDGKHWGSSMNISSEDVRVSYFSEYSSVTHEIEAAINDQQKALLYIVPSQWEPGYGVDIYDIPVLAVHTVPPYFNRLELNIDSSASWKPMEWSIPGYTSEYILIGDSRGSSESTAVFLEIARVFKSLTRMGWKPLRTIRFVSFPHKSSEHWANNHQKWLGNRVLAYVDVAPRTTTAAGSRVSASPSLYALAQWAAQQFADADLDTSVALDPVYASPYGSNTLLFDHQIPSISASLRTPQNHARFLALVLLNLAQEAVLPMSMTEYTSLIPFSAELNRTAQQFDKRIDEIKFNFSREYPWYQGTAKWRSLIERKQVNLIMSLVERQFAGEHHHHHHVLYSLDNSGTHTVLNHNRSEIEPAVNGIINELKKALN